MHAVPSWPCAPNWGWHMKRCGGYAAVLVLWCAMSACGSAPTTVAPSQTPPHSDTTPCASTSLDCGGHGTCSDTSGTAICTCTDGYTGDHCEVAPVPPATCNTVSLDCGNHGSCDDSGASIVCVCNAGYSGAQCETINPTCDTAPLQCGSHGACTDAENGTMYCACSDGCTGETCSENCNPAPIFLFTVASKRVSELGGSRQNIDALAQALLPGYLPIPPGSTYTARGFISFMGDAIRDFPTQYGVPTIVPIYGVAPNGTTTLLASDWADFMDGTIATTITIALGVWGGEYTYFWTGSNNDGSASGHDCASWTYSPTYSQFVDGGDVTISNRSNVTENWLKEDGDSLPVCYATYNLLGLAYCTDNCL